MKMFKKNKSLSDGPYFFKQDKIVKELNYDIKGIPNYTETDVDTISKVASHAKDVYENVSKIFAIGDVHGEYVGLLKILKNNEIIDQNLNWIFGDGHLVFCGDIFDRGDMVTECLWLIFKLEKQAIENNGFLHYILGNHELMILKGDVRYVNKKYETNAENSGAHYSYLFNKNSILGEWLRTKNCITILNNVLFVHGGISRELIEEQITIKEINDEIRTYLNFNTLTDRIKFLIGKNGPLWCRIYLARYGHDKVSEKDVNEILAHFGVKQIVFAHTGVSKIETLYKNKIIAIDVLLKKNKGEALFIEAQKNYRCFINKPKIIIN